MVQHCTLPPPLGSRPRVVARGQAYTGTTEWGVGSWGLLGAFLRVHGLRVAGAEGCGEGRDGRGRRDIWAGGHPHPNLPPSRGKGVCKWVGGQEGKRARGAEGERAECCPLRWFPSAALRVNSKLTMSGRGCGLPFPSPLGSRLRGSDGLCVILSRKRRIQGGSPNTS